MTKESKPKKKKKKPTANRYGVSAAVFVETWQTSFSVDEVMQKTGMPKYAVYSRVNSYKKKNIRLKKMPRSSKTMDVDALNAIVERTSVQKVKK